MSDASTTPAAATPPPVTLGQLSSWCFGEADAATAKAAERDLALPDHPLLRAAAYRFDPDTYRSYRGDYRTAAMQDLAQRLAMERLAGIFEKAGVRFAPIKGADIAANYYPDPALRIRCDLDVLVHPDDLETAERLARADNWRQIAAYEHGYHRPVLVRQNVHLELHFNLPRIDGERLGYIWEQLIPEPGTQSSCRLPPELTALLVFHHARLHQWLTGTVALADLGFMLAKVKKLDWARVDELADRLGIAAPQVFFHAFSGFFPAKFMPEGPPPEEILRAIRTAVHAHLNVDEHRELVMGLDRFSPAWWRNRLKGFRPSVVRYTYHLPPRGHLFRLLGGYLRMIGDKSKLTVRALTHRDAEKSSALAAVNRVEAYLSSLERK